MLFLGAAPPLGSNVYDVAPPMDNTNNNTYDTVPEAATNVYGAAPPLDD
jgi:hypothetical protein